MLLKIYGINECLKSLHLIDTTIFHLIGVDERNMLKLKKKSPNRYIEYQVKVLDAIESGEAKRCAITPIVYREAEGLSNGNYHSPTEFRKRIGNLMDNPDSILHEIVQRPEDIKVFYKPLRLLGLGRGEASLLATSIIIGNSIIVSDDNDIYNGRYLLEKEHRKRHRVKGYTSPAILNSKDYYQLVVQKSFTRRSRESQSVLLW